MLARVKGTRYFAAFPDLINELGWKRAVADVFATGDLSADLNDEQLFAGHACRVVTASAANFLSVGNEEWDDRFLDVEIEACRESGALDGGTHIAAVLERL